MSELSFDNFRELYLSAVSRDLPGFGNNFDRFTGDQVVKRLYTVTDKLIDNAKKFNLTSILEPSEIIRKHLIDSLIPLGLLLDEGVPTVSFLDVGTGAGFPLLPWSCALMDDGAAAVGMDATGKKVAHIRESSEAAGLANVKAVQGRAEELASGEMRESFALVTARAVAELPVLMELCAAFVAPGGHFAALKGKAADEINAGKSIAAALGLELVRPIEYEIPGGDARCLVIYRKMKPTPKKYPRRYAEIVKMKHAFAQLQW